MVRGITKRGQSDFVKAIMEGQGFLQEVQPELQWMDGQAGEVGKKEEHFMCQGPGARESEDWEGLAWLEKIGK